jgi:sialidase-1
MKSQTFFFLCTIFIFGFSKNHTIKAQDNALRFVNLFDSATNPAVACYRIPAIITAPNGDVVVAIDERVPSCADLRGSNDINIVIRRSHDNGKTWSEIETVVNYPEGQSASDPSFILDETTNTLFLFFNFMDLNTEKDVYYFRLTQSRDNGKTWSEPLDITSQISKPEWHNDFKFISSGRGIQTRAGKLLHTLVNLENGLHFFGSDDHGKNWHLLSKPIVPGDESKIVELADGTWMINSRVNSAGIRYIHTSTDDGQTWITAPETSLIDPGCNASIIRCTSIADGADENRLLFANAKSTNDRQNLTIRISYDEGTTWTAGKTIYEGSSAYSSMTILANGDIGLFFEADNYRQNTFVRISLAWLTDGNDKYNIGNKH